MVSTALSAGQPAASRFNAVASPMTPAHVDAVCRDRIRPRPGSAPLERIHVAPLADVLASVEAQGATCRARMLPAIARIATEFFDAAGIGTFGVATVAAGATLPLFMCHVELLRRD